MELRDYQKRLSMDAATKLRMYGIVYLAMEVRTGKTLTAFNTCELYGAKRVLFLTKKKAMKNIQWDYDQIDFTFRLTVANDESMHTVDGDFDLVIHDEHHRFAAYPKPSERTKYFRKRFGKLPMIFLSGTPTPESYSQWFHQFWVSERSPFPQPNFYKWAAQYVNVKDRYLGHARVNDYSEADNRKIMGVIRNYVITFTQAQAGFTSKVDEMVLFCDMKPITYHIVDTLHRELVVKNKKGQTIMGDTGVKLMQKTHQIFSGTVKFEDGTSKVIDDSKAVFIKEAFKGKKIAIFYKFVEEYNALRSVFGDAITDSVDVFDTTDTNIALQIVSGREGISLKKADHLVYYNIDFSAVSYWQSRDRLTTMDRLDNTVFWVFAKGGIEQKIYQKVLEKKDYTSSLFVKDYGIESMHIGSKKYRDA